MLLTCMTDDEAYELLLKLAAQRVAKHGLEDRIDVSFWCVGAVPSRNDLIAGGATPEQADSALARLKATLHIADPPDTASIPADLALEMAQDLEGTLNGSPVDTRRRLDEKLAKWIGEYRVEIYTNEGKHRGMPHAVVTLPDGQVSVSLNDPVRVLTPHGYRDEATAVKVVRKHRRKLLKLWHATRPGDQKLPPR